MTASALLLNPPRSLTRLIRAPKRILLMIFLALGALAATATGAEDVLPNLLVAMSMAAAIDLAVVSLRRDQWVFPDGAILTGAIIAFLLRPQEPIYVIVLSVAVALGSKHVLRTRWSNVFNPAAVALVFSGLVFSAGHSWWGALPDLGLFGALALLTAGAFIAERTNKLPMVLVFLFGYFSLFSLLSGFSNSADVAALYRAPDIHAVLFFALFMLDDPPTSPVRYEDQVVYGLLVATLAYLIFVTLGSVYYLPLALLAGNAWESGRRVFIRARKPSEARLTGVR